MIKISDEIFLKGIDEWLKLNPSKTINNIIRNNKIVIDDNEIPIGTILSNIRLGRKNISDELKQKLEDDYGFEYSVRIKKYPDDIYMKAINEWLDDNPDKNINEIAEDEKVNIDGEEIPLGNKIQHMRSGQSLLNDEYMNILYKKYNFLHESRANKHSDEIILQAIDEWLKQNSGKTINDIEKDDKIVLNGKIVGLGRRMSEMRNDKNLLSNENMELLKTKYGFVQKPKTITEEDWMSVIEEWSKLYKDDDINNIKHKCKISLNGELYSLGYKIKDIKRGKNLLSKENMKILKEKYGFRYKDETGFVREIEPLKKENITIKEKPYEKYLEEFNGDIELAKEKYKKVKEINRLIREERKNKKNEITLDELEKEFNINLEELDKYLNQIKGDTEKSEILYIDENETLRNYCVRHGYNYSVIYNLIKKSKECNVSFKQIINEYLKNGQKLPARYVYDKNEILVKHILLGINVDSESVVEDMKHSYTVDEAIIRDVFKRNTLDKKDKWLELPYTFLIEELGPFSGKNNTNIKFKDFESLLNKEEQSKLMDLYDKCSKALREYQYLQVGLEKDINKRKELIKKYSLTDDEITKSTLKSMEYENGIKITKKDIKSERLKAIQPVIINWNGFNQEAKNKLVKAYKLTKEELELIEKINKEIQDNLGIYKELLIENNVTNNEIDTIKQYHKNYYYNMDLYSKHRR